MSAKTSTTSTQNNIQLADAEIHEFKQYRSKALFLPVNIASLVAFRIFFGLVLLWEIYRYFDKNFIQNYWIKPVFLFNYWPFTFVKPLPGDGMYILYYFLAAVAVCITIGLFYRVSTIIFFLGMAYSFLLDQARYLNHQYLICLISFIMIFLPANRFFAVDTRIFPDIRTRIIPSWPLWLLRFTVGIPYFFGGIAKINSDWLQGEPLRTWLAFDTAFPIIGKYFTEEWMIYLMSYSGLFFDLLIIPFLLWRKTRWWAFIIMILFNLMNAKLFEIGIFPWFMMFATTIFFHPGWPNKIRSFFTNKKATAALPSKINTDYLKYSKRVVFLISCWIVIQTFVPLRHLLIPGNVHWTEEGHKYAWHMKLRTKRSDAFFYVINKQSGEEIEIDPELFLTESQLRKMPGDPDMLWQFAHMLHSEYKKQGMDVTVHANVEVSLNGRVYQQMVSPETDLSAVPRPVIGHAKWILPLTTPLSNSLKRKQESEIEQ